MMLERSSTGSGSRGQWGELAPREWDEVPGWKQETQEVDVASKRSVPNGYGNRVLVSVS